MLNTACWCVCMQRLAELTAELHEFVALDGAPVVPISAVTGAGMDSLRSTIASALRQPGITTAATATTDDAAAATATETSATETTTTDTATSDSATAAVQQPGKKSKQNKSAAKHSSTSVQQQQQQQQQQQEGFISGGDVPAMASVLDYVSSPQLGTRMVLLMYQGTLTAGAHFASGRVWGYVRALRNEVSKWTVCSSNSSSKRACLASVCGASATSVSSRKQQCCGRLA
jgi:translation initiation factor IF-2